MASRVATPPVAVPVTDADKRVFAAELLRRELRRLDCGDLQYVLTFSDADWRREMMSLGCPVYQARLASPTARRGTRGKLGMATICHFKHDHPGVVYIRTHQRPWHDVVESVRHEALHLARPSYNHRRLHEALRSSRPSQRRLLRGQLSFNI